MKHLLKIAAALAAFTLAAGCGDQRGADGLTSEERESLNQIAVNLDGGSDVVDASPDSLVANDEWTAAETGDGADAAANAAPPSAPSAPPPNAQ